MPDGAEPQFATLSMYDTSPDAIVPLDVARSIIKALGLIEEFGLPPDL
jgi:hypothetical protein